MMMAGSYGTSAGLTIEALCIIAGPPFTLVAGIALLFHKPWARLYLMALLFAFIAFNGYRIISGSSPSSTHSSADGVVNTRFGSPAQYSVPIIAVCIGLLLLLFSRGIRSELGISTRTGLADLGGSKKWRVGHHGRDTMYYEEEIGGEWQRIDISGEMLTGKAHHVIYFHSPERWQSYPEWARHRRTEIISRIKSEFREPEYEYCGDEVGLGTIKPLPVTATPHAVPSTPNPPLSKTTPKQIAALGLVILVFLSLASGMFGLVNDGIQRGETYFPAKRPTQRRSVSRQQEPKTFWASLGIYAFIGAGASGLALWFIQQGWKEVGKIRRDQ